MSAKTDQLIDQLAFGKSKPASGPCLGLYLSPETIYIAETRPGKNGSVTVDHLGQMLRCPRISFRILKAINGSGQGKWLKPFTPGRNRHA